MGRRLDTLPEPFSYPTEPHTRKHGPSGYTGYESYRDWLRDEFCFRCVFCLKREQWDYTHGTWNIDHFLPQSLYPHLATEYDNLIYICHTCNNIKGKKIIPDPCLIALGDCLQVNTDGTITPLNKEGQRIIQKLKLNNDDHIEFRHKILQTLRVLARHDRPTFILWMKYPDNLPDLRPLRPYFNKRPEGIENSHYERRKRNELSELY